MASGSNTLNQDYPMEEHEEHPCCEECSWDVKTPYIHEGRNVCKLCWHLDLKPNAPEWKAPQYLIKMFDV